MPKRRRNESESDREEEDEGQNEEQEEEENEDDEEEYEKDFVNDEEEESAASSQEEEKQPEVKEKAKKKRQESDFELEEDDLDLIEENTKVKQRQRLKKKKLKQELENELYEGDKPRKKFKKQKAYQSDAEEDMGDFIEGGEVQQKIRIAHDSEQYRMATELFGEGDIAFPLKQEEIQKPQQLFEPAEVQERYATEKDEIIKQRDIPERLQLRFENVEDPNEDEIKKEAVWITKRLTDRKLNPNIDVEKVSRFLTFYRVNKQEIPFIQTYRNNLLQPDLDEQDMQDIQF